LQLDYGIDLQAILDDPAQMQIYTGSPDRAKLVFRVPFVLPTKSIKSGTHDVLQYRCSTKDGLTVQDVVSGWHAGNQRQIEVNHLNPQLIPPELLAAWRELMDQGEARPPAEDAPTIGDVDLAEVRDALKHLDPDMDRAGWYRVGMALHSLSPDLFDDWDVWSAGGSKYAGGHDTYTVWNSFGNSANPVTIRSLFKTAQQAGWVRQYRAPEVSFQPVPLGHDSAPISGTIVYPVPPIAQNGGVTVDQNGDTPVRALIRRAQLVTPDMVDDVNRVAVNQILLEADVLEPGVQGVVFDTLRAQLGWNQRQFQDQVRFVRRQMQVDRVTGPVFPEVTEAGTPKDHTDNLVAICQHHEITIRHNLMSHEIEVTVPGEKWLTDEQGNQQLVYIKDKQQHYGMPNLRAKELILNIGAKNAYHPFGTLLNSTTWDGIPRLNKLLNTIHSPHPRKRDLYVTKWMISVVAAVFGYGQYPPRGVLAFVGPQAKGKTSLLKKITPQDMFGEGQHLDPHNKDSVKLALKYLVVELGELDETFRRGSIGAIKAHISKDRDEIRLPYAPSESFWPRRTVYAASVNNTEFLVDKTGNTRFWPVEITGFDLDAVQRMVESGEMLQIWKEVESMYRNGDSWLLTQQELEELSGHNEQFQVICPAEEVLLDLYNWDSPDRNNPIDLTNIMKETGYENRSGSDRAKMRDAVKKLTGQKKGIHTTVRGVNGRFWYLPQKRKPVAPNDVSVTVNGI
ncbi:MAG: hypothetical protein GY934_20265, partial [Gammaproteobacteria bacterium]|nr:hypothetical protein [Gammaproteobacteria bacterium]